MFFKENGHLTQKAISAICNETANEIARLEISEHLGFCDDCLGMYLTTLSAGKLMSPQTPLVMPVQKAISLKSKVAKAKSKNYRAITAVSLLVSVGIWATSSFLMPTQIFAAGNSKPHTTSFNQRVNNAYYDIGENIGNGIEDLIDSIKNFKFDWSFLDGKNKK